MDIRFKINPFFALTFEELTIDPVLKMRGFHHDGV